MDGVAGNKLSINKISILVVRYWAPRDRLVLVLVKVVDLGEAGGLVSAVVDVHKKSSGSLGDNLVRLALKEGDKLFLLGFRVVGGLALERTFLAFDHV